MVTMKDIRNVVLQEIEERFNPFRIQTLGDSDVDSIEVMSKPGFPVISVDFGSDVEVYRTTDPDDVKMLIPADPNFIDRLCEVLDYFYVPRR